MTENALRWLDEQDGGEALRAQVRSRLTTKALYDVRVAVLIGFSLLSYPLAMAFAPRSSLVAVVLPFLFAVGAGALFLMIRNDPALRRNRSIEPVIDNAIFSNDEIGRAHV